MQTGVVTNKAGSYGDALHHPAIAVHDNFPENSASVGDIRTCNPLKTHGLLALSLALHKKSLLHKNEEVCTKSEEIFL